MIDLMLSELQAYGRALHPDEQERLRRVLAEPLKKVGAISHAASIHVWAFLLLTIILEQQKELDRLKCG